MAKPSLALIPSGVANNKVFSVLPSNGDGDFDFSRGSTATRVNSQGLIETVSNDLPRLDYSNGGCPSLLLEPSRTNFISYSEDFSQWTGAGYTTANYAISPDGTQNASRCLFTGSNQFISFLTTATGNVTGSIYIKGIAGETIQISVSSFQDELFTLSGEWQRISTTATTTNGNFNVNTFGSVTARDFLIFAAQYEQGSYATSYIPTNGSTATRLAETCNGAGNAATFNDSEGVLMAKMSALADDGIVRTISIINSSSTGNLVRLYYIDNKIVANVKVGGVTAFEYVHTLSSGTEFIKLSLKYKQNDYAFWVNGIKVDSEQIGNTPTGLSVLSFDYAGGSDFYGKTKEIRYYDTALTDEELEYMTSYRSLNEMVTELNLNTL